MTDQEFVPKPSEPYSQLCLGCPGYAWDENYPGGVYGPETHPRAFGSHEEPHEWQPADIVPVAAERIGRA